MGAQFCCCCFFASISFGRSFAPIYIGCMAIFDQPPLSSPIFSFCPSVSLSLSFSRFFFAWCALDGPGFRVRNQKNCIRSSAMHVIRTKFYFRKNYAVHIECVRAACTLHHWRSRHGLPKEIQRPRRENHSPGCTVCGARALRV